MSLKAVHPSPDSPWLLRLIRIHIGLALFTAVLAGLLSVLMRFQMGMGGQPIPFAEKLGLLRATGGVLPPELYGVMFTLHGAGMFFFVLLPSLGPGFGTLALDLDRLPLPRSVGALFVSGLVCHLLGWFCLVISPIAGGGGPAAGWSVYPPLSLRDWSPGSSLDWFLVALVLWGCGALLTAMGQIAGWLLPAGRLSHGLVGILRWDSRKLGHLLSAFVALFAVPSLLVSMGLLLSDRSLGTSFLGPPTGTAILHQHLFWFFGHPAVYMLILPVMGLFTSQILPGGWQGGGLHRLVNGCLLSIGILGFAAWGHHMFQAGLDPRVSGSFSTATLLISWPSAILVGAWVVMVAQCVRDGTRRPGFWYAVSFLVTFSLGGVGGVLLATAPMNAHLHETYWVVGHIHLVLFGGTVLGLSAAYFLEAPRLLGQGAQEGQRLAHLILTVPLLLLVFGLMHWMGWQGLGRRMYEVPKLAALDGVLGPNRATAWAAFALVTVQGLLPLTLVDGMRLLYPAISRALATLIIVIASGFMALALGNLLSWGWIWVLGLGTILSSGAAAAMLMVWLRKDRWVSAELQSNGSEVN